MEQSLGQITLLVKDYNEAIAWYVHKLRFKLLEDTELSPTKRWVRVAPQGQAACALLLAKASDEQQIASVGNQTGGRVFLFLYTDDFWRDYNDMKLHGVHFVEDPREEAFGTVVVFEDLYGNKWDFIQPKVPVKT